MAVRAAFSLAEMILFYFILFFNLEAMPTGFGNKLTLVLIETPNTVVFKCSSDTGLLNTERQSLLAQA